MKIDKELTNLLAEYAEFWSISDLKINYLKESICLTLISVKEIVKTFIEFKEVMSCYYFQDITICFMASHFRHL